MSRLISVKITEVDGVEEPVSLEELKNWMKIEPDESEDDELIAELGKSSRKRIERFVGLVLVDSHIKATYLQGGLGANRGDCVEISYGPVTEESMDNNNFDGSPMMPYLFTTDSKMVLEYDSSWGLEGAPEWAKTAIKTEVAYRYENRGDNVSGSTSGVYVSDSARQHLSTDTINIIQPFRNTLHEILL